MKRDIFQYEVGGGIKDGVRYADPVKVLRLLAAECNGDLAGVVEQCKSENPAQRTEAAGKFIAAGRVAFGMTPFNPMTGDGAMDEDVLAVLDGFWDFLEKKNVRPENSPTSRPVLASAV